MTTVGITPEMKQMVYDHEFAQLKGFMRNMTPEEKKVIGADFTSMLGYRLICNTSFPSPMFNKVVGNFTEQVFDHMEELSSWFRERHDSINFGIIPHPDMIPVVNRLTREGYELKSFGSYWLIDLSDRDVIPTDTNIAVVNEDTSELFSTTALKGFGVDENNDIFTPMYLLFQAGCRNDAGLNILYQLGEEAVGTGSVFMHENAAFLFSGSTLPQFRGNQIQQKLVNYRLNWAKSQGAEYAFVSTGIDTTSGRNMQRTGFQLAFNALHYGKNL